MTTDELENSLSSEYFMRIHKFYIVAIDNIKEWESNTLVINNEIIRARFTHRRALSERLKHNDNL